MLTPFFTAASTAPSFKTTLVWVGLFGSCVTVTQLGSTEISVDLNTVSRFALSDASNQGVSVMARCGDSGTPKPNTSGSVTYCRCPLTYTVGTEPMSKAIAALGTPSSQRAATGNTNSATPLAPTPWAVESLALASKFT